MAYVKQESEQGLCNEALTIQNGNGVAKAGVAANGIGLTDILIEQAMREEAIINEMKAAVIKGDKDAVFLLAKELTC